MAVCLGALSGAALVEVRNALRGWEASLAGSMTLQLPAETSAARLQTVVALLRQTRGLTEVRLLEPEETARLVQPWLGPSLAAGRLPIPQIVDMRADGVGTPDFADLRQKLASIVPDSHLEDRRQSLTGWRAEAYRLSGAIAILVALAVLISVSAAVSHARSTLVLHRDELELLHLLGAGDNDIARRLAGDALLLGFLGAVAGAIIAALTLLALGGTPATLYLSSPAGVVGIAEWRVWLILAGATIVGAAIPAAVARGTVMRRLAQMA